MVISILFRKHFLEAIDIGKDEEILEVAKEAKLSLPEKFLESKNFMDDVNKSFKLAHALGINGKFLILYISCPFIFGK